MAFDAVALAASLDEISNLVGTTVSRIHTTTRSGEVIFSTRGRGSGGDILVSIRREDARIQVTRRRFDHPDQPGAVGMTLRKHLKRARIEGVEQVGLDRIARIHLSARDELGHARPLILVAETMGRSSNLILIDPGDGDRILTALRFASADRNTHRSVLPGHPYRLPPQRDTLHPDAVTVEAMASLADDETPAWLAIVRRVDGPGPATVRRLLRRCGMHPKDPLPSDRASLEPLVAFLRAIGEDIRAKHWDPWLYREAPEDPILIPRPGDYGFLASERPPEGDGLRHFSRPSAGLDAHYALGDAVERLENTRRELQRALESAHESILLRRERQRADLARADSAEEMRIHGELLTAYMHRVPAGVDSVQLPDYYAEGQPREIPLKSNLSPADNASRFFKEYRRLQRTEKKARRQLRITGAEIDYIEGLLYQLRISGSPRELEELRQEVSEAGYLKTQAPPRRRKSPSPSPIEMTLTTGHRLLVGRNNRGNDHLTMRVASPEDLWFHVKDMPGSHVVLPGPWDEALPEPEVLEEAARVAAQHSTARDSSNVPVDYTLVKHVSKPKGAHPGMVIYRKQKTLYVTPRRD